MAPSLGDALAAARTALANDDEPAALRSLIQAWGVTRAAPLAEAVNVMSARLEPFVPTLIGPMPVFHPSWLAMARQRRPVDVPRLLETVTHHAERGGVAIVEALIERGAHLLGWPPDPRTGAWLFTHLTHAGYASKTASTFPFWQRVFDAVIEQDDPRLISSLSTVSYTRIYRQFSDAKKRIPWFQAQVERVAQALRERHPKGGPVLPAGVQRDVAALTKLIKARPKPSEQVRASVAAVAQPVPERVTVKKAAKPEPGTVIEALARADEAFAKGEQTGALEALLSAWRIAPAGAIAELVAAVSRRVDGRLEAIAGTNRAQAQSRWLSVAKKGEAADFTRLLWSLMDTGHRTTDALARLKALEGRPRDPRTLEPALALLRDPPYHSGSTRSFWSALVNLIIEHGDHRAPAALDAIAAQYPSAAAWSWLRTLVTHAAERLRAQSPTDSRLDSKSLELWARLRARLKPEEEQLARIAEHPEADQLRAVYADQLQERGDPRGELIALQLSGSKDPRIRALERAHAWQWIQPLPRYSQVTFERGFVATVVLPEVPASVLERLVGDPVWATVKEITVIRVTPTLRALLAHPVMRSLERVYNEGGARRRLVPFR